jgi:hypothetical protein
MNIRALHTQLSEEETLQLLFARKMADHTMVLSTKNLSPHDVTNL